MEKIVLGAVLVYKNIAAVLRFLGVPVFIYTDCKFHPSCSDYATEAINKYGVIKGSTKSLARILRCSPFSKGGMDLP